MELYIKDMDIPETCFECPFMYARRYCCANLTLDLYQGEYEELKGRIDGCPLIPIPPHGRLIDADALLERMKRVHDKWKMGEHYTPTTDDEIMTIHAPTVIPASDS